jgi:hypothetical protein
LPAKVGPSWDVAPLLDVRSGANRPRNVDVVFRFARDSLRVREMDSSFRFRCVRRS